MDSLFSSVKNFLSSRPNQSNLGMTFFYLNARSLRNKFDDIKHLIDQGNNPEVIIVAETWIKPGEERYFSIHGYTSNHTTRMEGRGGGVSVYVRNEYTLHPVSVINNIHIIQRSVIKLYNKSYYLVSIYNAMPFLDDLERLLDDCDKHKAIIIGDANIDLLIDCDISNRYED